MPSSTLKEHIYGVSVILRNGIFQIAPGWLLLLIVLIYFFCHGCSREAFTTWNTVNSSNFRVWKLCLSANFHTKKLGEIRVFYAFLCSKPERSSRISEKRERTTRKIRYGSYMQWALCLMVRKGEFVACSVLNKKLMEEIIFKFHYISMAACENLLLPNFIPNEAGLFQGRFLYGVGQFDPSSHLKKS